MAPPKKLANDYPWWKVRIWYGMTARAWFGFLRAYGFKFSVSRLHRLVLVSLISPLNSALAGLQTICFGSRLENQAVPPCVFVIGHWRTGTTFLHELLANDPRLVAPTALQVLCPEHFMLSRKFSSAYELMSPKKRPMDNIEIRMDAAQEDEFALMLSGPGSPLDMFAYPQGRERWRRWFRPEGADRASWLASLERCFKGTAFLHERTTGQPPQFLLLKSPTHTARLALLAEQYPSARFIHLVRNPLHLFSSTSNMIYAMVTTQALELPQEGADHMADILAYENLDLLYQHFDEDCQSLTEDRLYSLKYEDLGCHPLQEIKKIYDFLQLNLSTEVEEAIVRDLAARGDYKVQQHDISPARAAEIRQRWRAYGERFGYW